MISWRRSESGCSCHSCPLRPLSDCYCQSKEQGNKGKNSHKFSRNHVFVASNHPVSFDCNMHANNKRKSSVPTSMRASMRSKLPTSCTVRSAVRQKTLLRTMCAVMHLYEQHMIVTKLSHQLVFSLFVLLLSFYDIFPLKKKISFRMKAMGRIINTPST